MFSFKKNASPNTTPIPLTERIKMEINSPQPKVASPLKKSTPVASSAPKTPSPPSPSPSSTPSSDTPSLGWSWLIGFIVFLVLMAIGYLIIDYYYKKEEEEDRGKKPANGFTPFFNKIVSFFSGVQPNFFGGMNTASSGSSSSGSSNPLSISGPVSPSASASSFSSSASPSSSASSSSQSAFFKALNTPPKSFSGGSSHEPDNSFSGIQSKAGWCYVGEEKGIRSCAEVGTNDKCMSGDIFPSKEICINPKLRA